MDEWQNRPLDVVYPVIFIDAAHVKIRDGQVANRSVYAALAVTCEGQRDILGCGPAAVRARSTGCMSSWS
jgi:putative transposase